MLVVYSSMFNINLNLKKLAIFAIFLAQKYTLLFTFLKFTLNRKP